MKHPQLILASFLVRLITAQTTSTPVVAVHVVNDLTGTPIPAATVVLEPEHGNKLWGRTDAGGIFTAHTESADAYILSVSRKGYRQTGKPLGTMIDITAAGQSDITVRMRPLGVLAGRVLDQYGDPVAHAIVSTEDKVAVPGAGATFMSYWAATTNDLGEYRIAEVEPGKHYVAAEYNSADSRRTVGDRRWPKTVGFVMYPDTTQVDRAMQVEVGPGEITRLNDIHLKIRPALTISGRISPPPTTDHYSLSLARGAQLALHSMPSFQGGSSDATGKFEIEVLPGKYTLIASDEKTGKTSKPLTLEVSDKNIPGLELELTLGYEIHGRIVIDGPEHLDFSKILLTLGGPLVKIDANGTFETTAPGGKGVYMVQSLPPGWYVKDVSIGGKRPQARIFDLEPGTTDVSITLSPRSAELEIAVEGASAGLKAAMVILIPDDQSTPDLMSIPRAEPSASGTFVAHSLPPGSYRVFTLAATDIALMMRPDLLLQKHRALATLIAVSEGEYKKIVVPLQKIPE